MELIKVLGWIALVIWTAVLVDVIACKLGGRQWVLPVWAVMCAVYGVVYQMRKG